MVEFPISINVDTPTLEHLWQGVIYVIAAMVALGGFFSSGEVSTIWIGTTGGTPPTDLEATIAVGVIIVLGIISRIIQDKLRSNNN